MVKSFVTAVLISLILVMAVVLGLSAVGRSGANSAGLPQAFNQYRASIGVAPLHELSVLDTAAQFGSDNSCRLGGYILPNPPLAGNWMIWQVYGYGTAAEVMAAELTDPSIMAVIADPNANAVGVGVASTGGVTNPFCQPQGILWTIILGQATVLPTNPPRTATPTVRPTPTRTAISTSTIRTTATTGVTRTPTITGTPSVCTGPTAVTGAGSIICSCATGVCFIGHTTTPTLPATTPTPTRAGPVVGDLNCDGRLTAQDALVILIAIAENKTIPPC
jgi:hypothetical protein